MDAILCTEMAFLQGQTLAQSVLSCAYLHNQADEATVGAARLRSYCQAALKCVSYARILVVRADIYEEEDFAAATYGFGLCEMAAEAALISELTEHERVLCVRLRELRTKKGEAAGGLSAAEAAELATVEALRPRILFRRAHLAVLSTLANGEPREVVEDTRKKLRFAATQLQSIKFTGEQVTT